MKRSRIELALVLKKLGLQFKMDSFPQRLTIQKKVYLAQLAGLDLGYRFSWYIRGPYSTGLTEDTFALLEDIQAGDNEFETYLLQSQAESRLRKIEPLWPIPKAVNISKEDWLELLASLHYLRHIAYRPKDASCGFQNIFNKLIESKPRFHRSKKEARLAWGRLDELGLVRKKTLA